MLDILDEIKDRISVMENLEKCAIQSDFLSKKGDGFVGDIHRVALKGIDRNSKQIKELHLILKLAPKDQILRSCMPIQKMYRNEFYAYETVLPTLETFYRESKQHYIKIPKFYMKKNEAYCEYLVLEDLNIQDFKMINNKTLMDDDHTLLILENLAKFHGSSMIVKNKSPGVWKELCGGLNFVSNDFFGQTDYCDAIISQAKSLDVLFQEENERDVLEKFMEFCKCDLKNFMGKLCSGPNDDFVIVNGDLWSNNLLFKYEDTDNPTKPTGLAILDFQAMRLSSFAIDVSYFFYVSSSKDTMDRIDDFLLFYYRKLEEMLREFGLDPEEIFCYRVFLDQWKMYNKFGLAMALVVLHGIASDTSEFPNLREVLDSGESFWFALNFISKNEDIYKKRVKDLIVHFFEKKYL